MRSVTHHISITGTPDLGADGKDYRANFVHAPFPEISSTKRPLRERGSAAASLRYIAYDVGSKRHYDECYLQSPNCC